MLLVTEHDELLPSATAAHARMKTAQARLDGIAGRTEATIDVFMVNKATVAREHESLRRYVQRAMTIGDDLRAELRAARRSSRLERRAHAAIRTELARAIRSSRLCTRQGRELSVSLAAVAAGDDPGAIARAHTPPPTTKSRAVLSRRHPSITSPGEC